MLTLLAIVLALIAFDVAALLWGVDSREGMDDPEWERRQNWRGFGAKPGPPDAAPASLERRDGLRLVK